MRWSAGCPLPASSSGPGAGIRLSRHHRHPTLPSTCPASQARDGRYSVRSGQRHGQNTCLPRHTWQSCESGAGQTGPKDCASNERSSERQSRAESAE